MNKPQFLDVGRDSRQPVDPVPDAVLLYEFTAALHNLRHCRRQQTDGQKTMPEIRMLFFHSQVSHHLQVQGMCDDTPTVCGIIISNVLILLKSC